MAKGKWAAEWKNLKEEKIRFRYFAQAIDAHANSAKGSTSSFFRRIGQGVTDAYATAARYIRDRARSNAAAGRVPRRLFTGPKPAIFAFSDFNASSDPKRNRSSMVGIRTGLSARAKDPNLFIAWGVGSRRRKDGSIAQRGLSMSFGALFERGTRNRRIRARRYFRTAVYATRGYVLNLLTDAYRRAADSFQNR